MRLLSTLSCTLTLVFCAACDPPTETSDAGTADAGPGGVSIPMKMVRYHFDADGESVEAPAVGAVLVADLPGGERVELSPDAEGLVTLDNVEFSLGELDLTSFLDGCMLQSALGFDTTVIEEAQARSDDGVIPVYVYCPGDNGEPSLVTISGSASNMANIGHEMTISTNAHMSYHQGSGPDWSLQVPLDTPFTLVALEWSGPETPTVGPRGVEQVFYQWTVIEHAGVSADSVLDLDFAASRSSTHFSGSASLPTLAVGNIVEYGSVYMMVNDADSPLFLGAITRSDVSSDGFSFEYEGEYLALDGVNYQHQVRLSNTNPLTRGYSYLNVPGAPSEGEQIEGLLEPQVLDAPAMPGIPYSIDGSISWQRNPNDAARSDLFQQVYLFRSSGPSSPLQPVWFVSRVLGSSANAIDFPTLPSGFDRSGHFGDGDLTAYLNQSQFIEEGEQRMLGSQTGPFLVKP